MISASLNAALSTNSDIRKKPISTNSSHCSERHKGSHSKNWDKTTPRKTKNNSNETKSGEKNNTLSSMLQYVWFHKLSRHYSITNSKPWVIPDFSSECKTTKDDAICQSRSPPINKYIWMIFSTFIWLKLISLKIDFLKIKIWFWWNEIIYL